MEAASSACLEPSHPVADEGPTGPIIVAELASSFTFASHQNAIPVLRSVRIDNLADRRFENCRLELTASPGFLRSKTWIIDRLVPGDTLSLADRKVDLDAQYLVGLNEAERGEIVLRLSAGGELLDEQRFPVRLLARDEWGGMTDMAQLLPAFVMPNDGGVAHLLRRAAERLEAHGHPSALDGYQSQDPRRAFIVAAALYSAVAGLTLHYAEPPASFEARGQKVRRPGTIERERLATCLDTTLLFAAAMEAAGLNPVVLLFADHAAVGVWLTRRTFGAAIGTDVTEVRKALASREFIAFETTGVAQRPVMTLEAAQRAIERRLSEEESRSFAAAIDIRRSRSNGIMPLASHDPVQHDATAGDPAFGVALPLPQLPTLAALPGEVVEQKPTNAAGRIDRWQKRLLDLTLRNRLLNLADSKRAIPFLCTDLGALEDRLAGGAAIRMTSLPEQNPLGERDVALHRELHNRDLYRDFAADALLRDELPSQLAARELEARLIDLHRQAKSDLAEGGANTLFLAVGFLRWKKKPQDERSYRAPLLLVPVKLERRSATSHFSIRFHEDEPRFNDTLAQFLQQDFELALPRFGEALPRDKLGVDIPAVLTAMRQAVRDAPGMEVLDEAALSTFSFAKFLMWKDLVERTDALRRNRVVRHLIDSPEQAFLAGQDQPAFPDERTLDRTYKPRDIITLLPADSSQTAASLAAAEGRDFVLVGPPGTGKSQTITNMIAHCLAVGKTVLFVAEKTAALDVVHRRLREQGLGPHCIELHSNKAERRSFLGQLKAAWERGGRDDGADWVKINERLRLRRDALNAYVESLHRRGRNGWSPYMALGVALKGADEVAPELSWPERDALDAQDLSNLEELAAELGQVFASVERRPALDLVRATAWNSGWQDDLLEATASLRAALDLFEGGLDAFCANLGLQRRPDRSHAQIEALRELATALQCSWGHDVTIAFDRDFPHCAEAVVALRDVVARYRAAESSLSCRYRASAPGDIDAEALLAQWRQAEAAFWLSGVLGKRKIKALLQAQVEHGRAEPSRDLPLFVEMVESLRALGGNLLAGKPLPVAGLATDTAALEGVLQLAGALREAVRNAAFEQDERRAALLAIVPRLPATDASDELRSSAQRFLAAVEHLASASRRFGGVAGQALDVSTNWLAREDLGPRLDALVTARGLLRDWTVWRHVQNRALASRLGPLVEAIESGAVRPENARAAFRLGYARWWLPKALDVDAVLTGFRRFQHEAAIEDFRDIDDLVRKHATRRVVSAVAHGLPPVQSVPRNSELGLLRHQMELQRPSQTIREMIGRMPQSFAKLAPCMLMSPLSIAQYLPPDHALFDVVIFDEASQITTWDAVGAIARASQTIIVGDPKQLPPTNFFGRNEPDEDVADHEKDLESILDEARASGIPLRDLRWHYRSSSESLIAFSNHHYYENRLVTFPSPATDDQAVRLRKVPHGVYDRGKSRTNRIEAEAVVREAVSRMKDALKCPEEARQTLAVITFNSQQQALILDLLDAERRADPRLEWFFAEDRYEPTIVKNLENVQGDERDVVLFSITYWKDAAGKLAMDFGALNRDGGERRLNVAVTRARRELLVFSGLTADQIDAERVKGVGVKHLKAFLDYAERGAIALPAQDAGSVGGFDSPFEEAVFDQLVRRGWTVTPQVGISGFRIDLGVRHPDLPGAYLAGVECDGATYHALASARDRDKVREQVLKRLGWTILRVWSTDWWFDATACAERLDASLRAALERSRALRASEQELVDAPAPEEAATEGDRSAGDAAPVEAEAAPPAPPAHLAMQTGGIASVTEPQVAPEPSTSDAEVPPATPSDGQPRSVSAPYRLSDLSGLQADADRFFEFAYRDTLRAMIALVIEAEAPLRADVLAQRIARAHGWLRTGGRIREQIDLHLREADRTAESSGDFIWAKGAVRPVVAYRAPTGDETRRAIGDIPLAELAGVVLAHPGLLQQTDPPLDLARLLGVDRLTSVSRARLDEAIGRARSVLGAQVGAPS